MLELLCGNGPFLASSNGLSWKLVGWQVAESLLMARPITSLFSKDRVAVYVTLLFTWKTFLRIFGRMMIG